MWFFWMQYLLNMLKDVFIELVTSSSDTDAPAPSTFIPFSVSSFVSLTIIKPLDEINLSFMAQIFGWECPQNGGFGISLGDWIHLGLDFNWNRIQIYFQSKFLIRICRWNLQCHDKINYRSILGKKTNLIDFLDWFWLFQSLNWHLSWLFDLLINNWPNLIENRLNLVEFNRKEIQYNTILT